MLLVAIFQSLFCQNVSTENSSNFPFVKVSQSIVAILQTIPYSIVDDFFEDCKNLAQCREGLG